MTWYKELLVFYIIINIVLYLFSPIKQEGIIILLITSLMLTAILFIPYKLMQKKEIKTKGK